MDDLFRIQTHLFSKVGFDGGALHADGAFGGRQVRQQLRHEQERVKEMVHEDR